MRILMLSDLLRRGGAAIAATRLQSGLRSMGHEVIRVTSEPDVPAETLRTRDRYIFLSGLLGDGFADLPLRRSAERKWARLLTELRPDVVNVHNLHAARRHGWSERLVAIAAEHAPTVWTLHDMWSFTGRCAYNKGCQLFVSECDASCPTTSEYPRLPPVRVKPAWRSKRALLTEAPDIWGVTPSRWLYEEAQRGAWSSGRLEVIPYGLPLSIYRPLDRAVAREALGLPLQRKIVLVMADSLDDPRKAFGTLRDALSALDPSVTVISAGSGSVTQLSEGEVYEFGYIEGDRMKALLINAADVLLHTAIADNLPLVVQEAISCGTPVIALNVGGLPEMVRPGETGWLVDADRVSELGEVLRTALDIEEPEMRETCRRFAVRNWNQEQQADRYIALLSSRPMTKQDNNEI